MICSNRKHLVLAYVTRADVILFGWAVLVMPPRPAPSSLLRAAGNIASSICAAQSHELLGNEDHLGGNPAVALLFSFGAVV
ncbi:hypothetical protein K523DRAFT_414531 [Schizophyllum commune Tattone D]|nr:hypothetical protein K523DRAFT_414531 [Schizophyllum commune Tattone D]